VVILCILTMNFASPFSRSFGLSEKASNSDSIDFEKLLAMYWNWWLNLPEEANPTEDDGQTVKNKCVIHNAGSVVFLLDSFSLKNFNQECEIPVGSSIFFPFYTAWCDNGIKDLYGEKSYERVLNCALDDDRGIVTMEAWLDGKKIIDVVVDNTDIHNLKVLKNNLPQSTYYKEIRTSSFYNQTVTNKTQYTDHEKPEEFRSSPAIYQGVAHCFCGFISNMSNGDHELVYHTDLKGSTGADGSWDFESEVTYKFSVIQ
jgi:hypothetical protein